MQTTIVTVLFVVALCSRSEARDRWTGDDKTLHFGLSAALGAAAFGTLQVGADADPELALGLGATLAFLPGLAKELLDASDSGNRFSSRDLFWDAIGAVAGASLIWLATRTWLALSRSGVTTHRR